MKIQFTESFTESLKNLTWHESKLYKFYSFFRYDLSRFFRNVWKFRKVLWNHQWWDYRFTLEALHTSLSIMEQGMSTKGIEVKETREKKVEKMRRVLFLLQNKIDDNYIERAEAELGKLPETRWEFEETENGNYALKDNETQEERDHSKKVFDRSREIEDQEWKEIWDTLKGQNYQEFKELSEKLSEEERMSWKPWEKWYDGSDLRGWWD